MEDLVLEFHRNRFLCTELVQAGDIDGVAIIQLSSSSISAIQDYENDCGLESCANFDHTEPEILPKNKLHESLPSMQWEATVDRIISTQQDDAEVLSQTPKRTNPLRKLFDRRYGQETRDEAFTQLDVLHRVKEELQINVDVLDNDEKRVISSRQSQLRRRIFKLQRDVDVMYPQLQ